MANLSRPTGAPRRGLTLPAMHRNMNMTLEQAKETWAKLEAAIEKIHEQNASDLSFEELYRYAYSMVLHRHAQFLYSGMEEALRKHLRAITAELEGRSDMPFMKELLAKWQAYHKSTQMVRDILMYMDRTFVKNFDRTPVYQRGMEIWTEEIIRKGEVGHHLRRLFLEQVARERAGEAIDRQSLQAVTKMMCELGKPVYVADLERPFLDASREHFQAEAQRCLEEMDCPAYFESVDERLQAEEERAVSYLDATSSKPRVLDLLVDVFVTKQLETILNMEGSSFVQLLDESRIGVLARIYAILCRIPLKGPRYIKDLMATHVKEVGKALVTDSETGKDPVAFTQKVLDLRAKYMRIISEAFAGDRQFPQALHLAFESFLNSCPRSPEYVSLYVDSKLRKGLGSGSDAQADETLDSVLQIFRYLSDKDMFERFYKQHLSKRLLTGRVVNEEVEHLMLSKLKTECGYQFTCKLESMFTDMQTSADTMAAFRTHLKEQRIELRSELAVQVLTTGSWPSSAASACALPAELEAGTRVFDEFYRAKHNGRQLTWHLQMGTADLACTIAGKRHTISVTTHQMCVLMLLNGQPSITFRELAEATRIDREDLKPALIGMSMVKGKMLLRKVPAAKEILDGDVFSFNDKFKSPHVRIRFAAAGAQKEAEVASQVRQKVEEDRKHVIEAAIVRIMKARRLLDYNTIITEVTAHMKGRFVPVAVDIKKRLESLIERDFLERDANDRTLYRYMS